MGIAGGGQDRAMAENLLNSQQIDTGLEQMGGITVATGITTLLINRDASKFTILITPTTANRLSSFVVCVAKVTKLSS